MNHADTLKFYEWLRTRLDKKGYAPIGPLQPLDVGFMKQGAFSGTRVIAALDATQTSNTPTDILQQVEKWFQKLHGNNGYGCLIFAYHGAPSITTIEEIQNIGGYMIAGAHDLHSGKHWLEMHNGFEDDIYGD